MKKIFFVILLGFVSFATLAEQIQITNYPAARDIFWEQIYSTPGYTFYCGRRYTNRRPQTTAKPEAWE